VLNVQAVVVAYNRRDLLNEALAAISTQSRPLDAVHVVDNASTDSTSEMVEAQFPDVRLHTLTTNTGGAGGFAAGLAYALSGGADLVWLMDDDTVPTATALEELLTARESFAGPPPAAMASKVVCLVRLSSGRSRLSPHRWASGSGLLPVERRLRVHHPSLAPGGGSLLPSERG
jgi:rhamnopyranosyl-N-acetylglucosaminyl-diphospho-decaprenol beta-1,3/1,4-galactofuranosyltransferase